LRALAEARLQQVQQQLQKGSGIQSDRIELAQPATQPAAGTPVVNVKLRAAGG
jgi:hypothetical protein